MEALGVDAEIVQGEVNFRFAAQRNRSLSPGGCFLVIGSLGVLFLAVSAGFAAYGAWLILPFAGLDFLGLCLAFWVIRGRSHDFECISIRGERLVIERRENGRDSRFEFNRHWVQVILEDSGGRRGARLALRSHGREVEFGAHLSALQRTAMARQLRQRLSIR
ncbi:MAG: DUF2244 domain-containing protein [Burkholderiales bacterium]